MLDEDGAFRARVAEGLEEQDLDRASWLFLTRPDGWEDEFELLEEAAASRWEDERASREEQRAQRRVEHLTETVRRLRSELDELSATLAEAERAAATERSARLTMERERQELAERVDELTAERAETVRSLKETEAIAHARLEELREVRGQLSGMLEGRATPPADDVAGPTGPAEPEPDVPPAEPPPPAWPGVEPAAVSRSVAAAADAARSLADALGELARSLLPEATPGGSTGRSSGEVAAPPAGPDTGGARPAPAEPPARPPRRTPLRLRQGLTEDSPDGLEQLLATPGVVTIVDGYNVSQEGWPALDATGQRDALLSGLGGLRARTGGEVHVVFDGDAEGGRPSVTARLPVRVHFSPAELEADDVILDMVRELPTDVPVVVVSSDRRVADGARRLGANAVRSRHLLTLLGR